MHFKQVKGILSAKNGMNLYRGCTHGCIYCDARSVCYNMAHAFTDVEVKENALELLENALRTKRKKCMIGMGAMTDPYIPLERQLKHTRKALMLIEKYGFGATLITKSADVLRDIDVLKKINEKAKCVVQMTLTTYDDALCKIVEPCVSVTSERFQALQALQRENIETVVWLCPILPFINDTKENLLGILDMCVRAKVKGVLCFQMGMTLREGNREYYYEQLDKHFKGLKEKYMKTYQNAYFINSEKSKELFEVFDTVCEKHNIMHYPEEIFAYLNAFEEKEQGAQMSMFEDVYV